MGEGIALGFCNNVDYEIVWDADVIQDLASHYRIRDAEFPLRDAIQTERDLLLSILTFMKTGEGGERFVAHSDLIEAFARRFEKKITLGGTSVRAAIAMQKLGYSAALHLITLNDQVRRLVPADFPYVCSNSGDTNYPHLIVQYGLGDRVCAGDMDIRAPRANRLIYHCNDDRIALKLNESFSDLIGDAQVLLVSGFNAMHSRELLAQRLATLQRILAKLPARATVFLEDGGYYHPAFRQDVLRSLGTRIDVYSMNEDELQSHLKRNVALHDEHALHRALKDLHRQLPAAVIVVHTQNWALAYGKGAHKYAMALRAGVTLATARFLHGDDFDQADVRTIATYAPDPANESFVNAINELSDDLYCVPVPAVDQTRGTTIGLGDAFVGGFLPMLLN